jgi:hypothetical protein
MEENETMLNIFKGIIIPVKAVEGTITITETVSVTGDGKAPVLSAPVKQGDAVAITGDLQVEKATGSNGTVIGFVHDHPEYDVDPAKNYTKAQAISAGMLRKCGVETVFADVRTVPAKASESITPGMYVEWSADGFKKTASSGTTKSDAIALTTQGTDNIIVVGLK